MIRTSLARVVINSTKSRVMRKTRLKTRRISTIRAGRGASRIHTGPVVTSR